MSDFNKYEKSAFIAFSAASAKTSPEIKARLISPSVTVPINTLESLTINNVYPLNSSSLDKQSFILKSLEII